MQLSTIPRLATLDWLRSLENSLRWATGKVLANFDMKGLLDTAVTQGDVVKLKACTQVVDDDGVPSMLILNSDRCSTEVAGVNYMTWKLRLGVLFIADPSPRHHQHRPDSLQHRLWAVSAVSFLSDHAGERCGHERVHEPLRPALDVLVASDLRGARVSHSGAAGGGCPASLLAELADDDASHMQRPKGVLWPLLQLHSGVSRMGRDSSHKVVGHCLPADQTRLGTVHW